MANIEKVYTIRLEATQAQQTLDAAIKQFNDLKTKSAAANQEVRESKEIYQENVAALRELVQQQKALTAAKKAASAGAPAMAANAALDKNLAQQKLLNSIIAESKIDWQNAKEAASAAGAAVGKQAASVKELQASVKAYGAAAAEAATTFAPGTIGALRTEINQLKADLDHLAEGSTEAAAAIQQIGQKESQLRKLANAVNATNPEGQARAFGVLNQAIGGVVGIAMTGAQVFGLSEQTAQKYAQQMQALTGVLYSVESVTNLLNGENLNLIKGLYASAKAWLTAGESATVAGRLTRGAVASTGIGLLVLAVGALIALFMDLGTTVKGSESTFTKYKAVVVGVFSGLFEAVKDYITLLYQLATLDFAGAIKTAQQAGKDIAAGYTKGRAGVLDEARRKEVAHEVEQTARYVEIIKSRGEDALALEVANARRKIDAEKARSKEQLDAVKEYLVLKNQLLKRQADEEKALALGRLEGLAAIDAAAGKAVIERQRAVLQERLQQQLAADELGRRGQSAATVRLLAEIQATEEAYAKEVTEKRQAAELAALNARISLRKAKGQEAFALEVAEAERTLQFLKQAAQRDEAAIISAQAHLADLRAARAYELTQRRYALTLAELDAIISLENTKGQDSYQQQVDREERALAFMKQAGTRNLAQEVAQQSKIDNLKAAHALKVEADERAADLARLNARIAFLQAHGEDTTQLLLNLKAKELTTLLAAATRNEAAIIAKQGEIDALIEQQQVLAVERRRALRVEEFENEMALAEKRGKDVLALRIKFAREQVALDTDTSEKGLAQRRADVQKLKELEQEMSQRGPDLGGKLLKELFHIKDEDILAVKAAVTAAVSQIWDSTQQLAGALLDGAMQQTEQALTDAQNRLQEATSRLSELQNQLKSDENDLESAQGARKNYLLDKLAKEREEIGRLSAAKAKAAAEEKKQTEAKHQLEKKSAELSAASALATNVAAAASAVYAGIKAVEQGSKVPFPGNLVAIASGIAAVVAAVASAKQLSNATKYADGTSALGSDGVLRGPRHGQGGIQLFGRSGVHYGEAEGGEAIIPRDASALNAPAIALLLGKGRTQQLAPEDFAGLGLPARELVNSIIPTPPSYSQPGGVLNRGGVPGGQASAADLGALAARLDRQSGILTEIAARLGTVAESTTATADATAATASHTGTIKAYGPPVLAFGYEAEQKRRELSNGMDQSESFATL